ncbi:eIF-2-alpha kinase GCN2 isoform X2 [Bradysia coprophila]|uniref:eIF-2-alpha kinase GCN2 isoform X2 n=1 Tax=Bradysia coprophila TaxID=38358 RepID=UPI00187DCFBC|nr:eIF-2-alpha kinase GCN2 isoform X2 [Bradysia coprophila]
MNTKETFRDRQENELEVIQSIFGSDVEDLRPAGAWKPLNLIILLEPLQSSSGRKEVYPKVVPKITLEQSKGLSDALIEELTKSLVDLANELKGEVMIYELAQTVQAFLHKHNKRPAGSFYDQMLLEKLKRDEDLQQMQQLKLNQEKQIIRDEVLKRKEIFRSETKWRRDRRSISESSPTHRSNGSSEDMGSPSTVFRSRIYPNECTEHRSSDTLYFSNVGRKIQKGCCMGHSQKGCVAFSGIDLESGQLLYITEWNIKYSQLESKCIANCNRTTSDQKCNGHTVDEIIQSIEKQVTNLESLVHKNLIAYECVLCMKKKEGVVLYLVQDFVLGTSICSISGSLGWCPEGASIVAKGALDALIFLHNNGVSHRNLYDCTVFMDNSGTIRVTDFAIVPYLLELIGGQRTNQGDLPALGSMIESLSPTPHFEMRDFIEKCKSERTLSASALLDHPFLRPIQPGEPIRPITSTALTIPERAINQSVSFHHSAISNTGQSRLHTEFKELEFLGQGAYGDVMKVRNVLDNREYAIKRIPLSARNKQLYKKMTREVELLSRLNHENVVRYYNSWIESDTSDNKVNLGSGGDYSDSYESIKQMAKVIRSEESFSSHWQDVADDSSSDGIEFVNSDGDIIESDDGSGKFGDEQSEIGDVLARSPKPENQIMYIQMEFCEKSTLRTAIDSGLYNDNERLWRLFREIAEGLSHIHQQGMIHRDLKPVNIFLDSRDQVKIGDFGLATTSFLALQSQEQTVHLNSQDIGSSLTGKVGTALYVAPELTGNASKATYNQKVDLYSLGIILFEMSSPQFETGMERVKIMAELRTPAIIIPTYMLENAKFSQHVQVIKWLLNHDQTRRPTAEELLASELVPPAQLEANELQEMLRHALANPQSKSYKHLVARCLAQQSDTVLELTYHLELSQISPILEVLKAKIVSLFCKHGAVEVVTPLLSPLVKKSSIYGSIVRLMTHSGSVVTLPHDLRIPFAKHIALNGINMIRRYSVGRVYREKKVFNFHPKQLYECAFDIVTPNRGNLLVDAEVISIAYEITQEIPALNHKNISFRINHTSLLRAILLLCNVPTDKYSCLFTAISEFNDGKISKFQLHSTTAGIMQTTKYSAVQLVEFLLVEAPLSASRCSFSGTALRNLINGRGEAASLAKGAIRELESVISLAQGMGVQCPISVSTGLTTGYERAKSGGIIWQMLGDMKTTRRVGQCIMAVGGRYDSMLTEFQKRAQDSGVSIPNREISGVGFSVALEKIISALGKVDIENYRSMDVVICVTGSRPPLKEVTHILRSLWTAGIRTGVVEATGSNEAQDMAKDLGAVHVILFGGDGSLRVRSWNDNGFREKQVNRQELTEYIQKMLRPDQSTNSVNDVNQAIANVSMKSNLFTGPTIPEVEVTFSMQDKPTANMRRRYENQLKQHMSPSLTMLGKKEVVDVIVVELPPNILRAIIGAIDTRNISCKDSDEEIAAIMERFPKYKRYISQIVEDVKEIIIDNSNNKKEASIIGMYSIADSSYRIIL